MTIYKNIKDNKLYTVSKGYCGKYTGDIYFMTPYNSVGTESIITEQYFNKYLIPYSER